MDGFDEPEEPEFYDDPGDDEDVGGGEDPSAKDDPNIVPSGDPSAQSAAMKRQKNSVADLKKKKIPKEKRTTTPYMTKYEKARVLGTRALQIRYVQNK
jgi:DNA-directed RNA polymerase I, II, and III subunit RPABC2